jgi:ribosomal protein S18 acetylase RimI-like enzyme
VRLQRLNDNLVVPLSKMLSGIEGSFRPFGFSPAEIRRAAHEEDEHWVIVASQDGIARGAVLAYGMLRGWHEGYRRPSLGLAVTRMYRRRGLGTALLLHLHHVAARRGVDEIMLHVDDDNAAAKSLYLSMGYRPQGEEWICRLDD